MNVNDLYGQGSTIRGNTLSKGLDFKWTNTTSKKTGQTSTQGADGTIPLEFTQKEYNKAEERVEKRLNDEGLFPLKKDQYVQYTKRLILETVYGEQIANTFLERMVGIKELIADCGKQSKNKGTITAIDGRELYSRSPHSALNLLLQGSAGVIAKQWAINFHKLAEDRGLVYGKDWYQSAFVHDEYQCPALEEKAIILGDAMVDGCLMIQDQFDMNIRIEGDYQIGSSWAETH